MFHIFSRRKRPVQSIKQIVLLKQDFWYKWDPAAVFFLSSQKLSSGSKCTVDPSITHPLVLLYFFTQNSTNVLKWSSRAAGAAISSASNLQIWAPRMKCHLVPLDRTQTSLQVILLSGVFCVNLAKRCSLSQKETKAATSNQMTNSFEKKRKKSFQMTEN